MKPNVTTLKHDEFWSGGKTESTVLEMLKFGFTLHQVDLLETRYRLIEISTEHKVKKLHDANYLYDDPVPVKKVPKNEATGLFHKIIGID